MAYETLIIEQKRELEINHKKQLKRLILGSK